MEALFLTFFQQVNKRLGEMHHPQQADRFRRLGMFTWRCRLLRPQPETERRDCRLFSGNRILHCTDLMNSLPIPPQGPFVPILNYFHQKEDETYTRPLCRARNNYWWVLLLCRYPPSTHCWSHIFNMWNSQDKSPVNQKDLQKEDLLPKTSRKQQLQRKRKHIYSILISTLDQTTVYAVAHLKLRFCCRTPTIALLNC